MCCMALWQLLPLVYSSLEQHQQEDPCCKELQGRMLAGDPSAEKFQLQGDHLSYYPKGARRCRWVVPASLKVMLLKYFHDSILSGHLGA
jgi:hypothetical protein